MKYKYYLATASVMILFTSWQLIFVSCSSSSEKDMQLDNRDDATYEKYLPTLSLTDVFATEYKGDKRRLDIATRKADVVNKKTLFIRTPFSKIVRMEDVNMNIYENGFQVAKIHANTALMDLKTKDIVFMGGVEISSSDNQITSYSKVKWIYKSNAIEPQ